MLVAMTGPPGVGKSMLAEAIGLALPAVVVSVDPIEAALWRAGIHRDQPTGLAAYSAAAAVVESQLRLSGTAVVDAVNAAPHARQLWTILARGYDRQLRVIEVTCSDPDLHRERVEARIAPTADFPAPTWEQVTARLRGYRPWPVDRLAIDSADDFDHNVRVALRHLRR